MRVAAEDDSAGVLRTASQELCFSLMPHDWFSGWHRHASCRTGSPAQAKGAHACTQRCSCLHATFDKHPHLAYYVGIAARQNRKQNVLLSFVLFSSCLYLLCTFDPSTMSLYTLTPLTKRTACKTLLHRQVENQDTSKMCEEIHSSQAP